MESDQDKVIRKEDFDSSRNDLLEADSYRMSSGKSFAELEIKQSQLGLKEESSDDKALAQKTNIPQGFTERNIKQPVPEKEPPRVPEKPVKKVEIQEIPPWFAQKDDASLPISKPIESQERPKTTNILKRPENFEKGMGEQDSPRWLPEKEVTKISIQRVGDIDKSEQTTNPKLKSSETNLPPWIPTPINSSNNIPADVISSGNIPQDLIKSSQQSKDISKFPQGTESNQLNPKALLNNPKVPSDAPKASDLPPWFADEKVKDDNPPLIPSKNPQINPILPTAIQLSPKGKKIPEADQVPPWAPGQSNPINPIPGKNASPLSKGKRIPETTDLPPWISGQSNPSNPISAKSLSPKSKGKSISEAADLPSWAPGQSNLINPIPAKNTSPFPKGKFMPETSDLPSWVPGQSNPISKVPPTNALPLSKAHRIPEESDVPPWVPGQYNPGNQIPKSDSSPPLRAKNLPEASNLPPWAPGASNISNPIPTGNISSLQKGKNISEGSEVPWIPGNESSNISVPASKIPILPQKNSITESNTLPPWVPGQDIPSSPNPNNTNYPLQKGKNLPEPDELPPWMQGQPNPSIPTITNPPLLKGKNIPESNEILPLTPGTSTSKTPIPELPKGKNIPEESSVPPWISGKENATNQVLPSNIQLPPQGKGIPETTDITSRIPERQEPNSPLLETKTKANKFSDSNQVPPWIPGKEQPPIDSSSVPNKGKSIPQSSELPPWLSEKEDLTDKNTIDNKGKFMPQIDETPSFVPGKENPVDKASNISVVNNTKNIPQSSDVPPWFQGNEDPKPSLITKPELTKDKSIPQPEEIPWLPGAKVSISPIANPPGKPIPQPDQSVPWIPSSSNQDALSDPPKLSLAKTKSVKFKDEHESSPSEMPWIPGSSQRSNLKSTSPNLPEHPGNPRPSDTSDLPPWLMSENSSDIKPNATVLTKEIPLLQISKPPVWLTDSSINSPEKKYQRSKEPREELGGAPWMPIPAPVQNPTQVRNELIPKANAPAGDLPSWLSVPASSVLPASPPSFIVNSPVPSVKNPPISQPISSPRSQQASGPQIIEKIVIKEKAVPRRRPEPAKKSSTADIIPAGGPPKELQKTRKTGFLQFGDILFLSAKESIELKTKEQINYKGICIGNGISYTELECISRSIVKSQSNNVQFRQCLFRVEPSRQYGFLAIHEKYMQGKPKPEFAKILKSQADEEQEGNEAEVELTFGRIVTYGERIQLRHIHSNSFITISSEIANEHGALKVRLDSVGSEASWLEILPSNKLRQEGEPVRYIDDFRISAKIEKSVYSLHMGTSLLYNVERPCELNASDQCSLWKGKKYIAVQDLKLNPSYISTGDSFRIMHKDSETYLSAAPLKIETLLPDIVENYEEGKEDDALCIVGQPKEEKKVNRSTDVYLEKDKSSRSLWEIERLNPFKGGVATINEEFRLKNIATGLYLHIESSKILGPDCRDITNINTFNFLQKNTGGILNFMVNLKIMQRKTDTFIGLVEKQDSIETYFKGTSIEKHSEFSLQTFTSAKHHLQTTFTFEDEKEQNSSYVYQIATVLSSMIEIYKDINLWGFLKMDEEHYIESYKQAVSNENMLVQIINKATELLDNLKLKILSSADLLESNQIAIKDSGLLELFLKLLQLLDKRQSFPQKSLVRKKSALPLKFNIHALIQVRTESIILCPQMISRKYLNALASKIYRILFLCIKDNKICCRLVKTYCEFLGAQLVQYKEEVGKILKEVFRDATESINQSSVQDFQLWAGQIRSLNEKEVNWADQILILKIISSLCICRDEGMRKYQLVVEKYIFEKQIYFIDLCDIDNEPCVRFLPIADTIETFLGNNPTIEYLIDQSATHSQYIPISSLLFELKSYICAVLNLLGTTALSCNTSSREKIISHYKFTPEQLLRYVKHPSLQTKLKTSFLYLLRTLFVDTGENVKFNLRPFKIFEWDETEKKLVSYSPNKVSHIQDLIDWTRGMWIADILDVKIEAQVGQMTKFLIEIINISECLIDLEYVDANYIDTVAIKLAILLPNYSSDSIVKLTGVGDWCSALRKQITETTNLKHFLVEKILKVFSLISKVKLFRILESFIHIHTVEEYDSRYIVENFLRYNYNFHVTPSQSFTTYLLNVLLSHSDNCIKHLALDELVKILNQRLQLKEEVNDMIILHTDHMIVLRDQISESIKLLLMNITDLNLNFTCYKYLYGGLKSKNIKKLLFNIKINLTSLQSLMNTHADSAQLELAQNISRSYNLHGILLDFLNCNFYPWVHQESAYRRQINEEILPVYRSIFLTLSAFSFQHFRNQELIYGNISTIISFLGNSIGVSKLLSSVSSSQRASTRVEHIITYIFHLISMEAQTPDYSYFKILKNLIIDEKNQIYVSTQTDIAKRILKNSAILSYYSHNGNWNLVDYSVSKEKFHAVFISILALSAYQNPFVTMQCRNISTFQIISRELLTNTLSFSLKNSYFSFLLNVYFLSVSQKIKPERNLHEIIPILRRIVLPDLLNFSVYMADLIGIIQKNRFPAITQKREQLKLRPSVSEDSDKQAAELNSDEEEALRYWKYLIDVKPWKDEHESGLLIFIKNICIELKLSNFNPNDEFKQLIENISNGVQRLKAKIEGLSVKNPRMNFKFFIEKIGFCLAEFPVYGFEGEEDVNVEYNDITENYTLLMDAIRTYIKKEELTLEEFFLDVLKITSETVPARAFASALKYELKALSLSTINSGLRYIIKESDFTVNIIDFKHALFANIQDRSLTTRKYTISENLNHFIRKQKSLWNNNRDEELVIFMVQIKETIIEKMLVNSEYSGLVGFCKSLFTAFHRKSDQKYLFELFTQMIKTENGGGNAVTKKQRIEKLQNALEDAGIGVMAFNTIKVDVPIDSIISALGFLHTMLVHDNDSFKKTILSLIELPKFFFEFFSYIKSAIKDFKDTFVIALPIVSSRGGRSMTNVSPFSSSYLKSNLCKSLLKLIELLCENNTGQFQDLFREQNIIQDNAVSINLVAEIRSLLISFTGHEEIKKTDENEEGNNVGMVALQCLRTLTAVCEGPCVQNQKELGNSIKIYKFANWYLEDSNLFLSQDQENYIEISKWLIKFLHSLIEAETDINIMKIVLQELHIDSLLELCCRIHENFVLGKEEEIYRGDRVYPMWWIKPFESRVPPIDAFRVKIIEVGFSIFNFCLILKENFPKHEKLSKIQYSKDGKIKKSRRNIQVLDKGAFEKVAYNFYLENISKVEISYRGNLSRLYFQKPFLTRHLTQKSRASMMKNITSFTYQAKIEEFFKEAKKYKQEMIYQQRLERYPLVAKFCSKWSLYKTIAFYLTCAINIIILVAITSAGSGYDLVNMEATDLLYICSSLHFVFASMSTLAYFFEYSPIIYNAPRSIKIERFDTAMPRINGTLLQNELKLAEGEITKKTTLQKFSHVAKDIHIIYMELYFLVAILALWQYMWYGLLVLDSVNRSNILKNVLRSITLNYKQLLLTMVLGMIITYLFSIFGFLFFSQDYNNSSNETYCTNLFVCFITTLNRGLRGQGGIGTMLAPARSSEYVARIIFDMAFFIILIIVLLKVIFGIIIDTFATLREIRKEQIKNLEETCFICGMSKFEFDIRRMSWIGHVKQDHNSHAYLAFFIYMLIKKKDFNGIERFIKKQINMNEITFFPKSCIQFAKFENKEVVVHINYGERFKNIKNSISRITKIS